MIKIIKNLDAIPLPLKSASCGREIEKAMVEKGHHNFRDNYYAHDDVKSELKSAYGNKCAFCESDVTAGSALQVEHYRPKAKVAENSQHHGYFWLGYEWSNLLYACSKCNRAKWNKFPLQNENDRIKKPPLSRGKLDKTRCKSDREPLKSEGALLINPEIENPGEHLIFLPSGKIEGVTRKGKTTIETCRLHRDPLVIARKKLIEQFMRRFMRYVSDFYQDRIGMETLNYNIKRDLCELMDIIVENLQYSALARSMVRHFESFFIRRFSRRKDRDLLKKAYQNAFA